MYASRPYTSSLPPHAKRMKKCTTSKPLNPIAHLPNAQHHDQLLDLESFSETDLKELKHRFLADVARIRSVVKQIQSRQDQFTKKRAAPVTPDRQNNNNVNNKRQCIRNTAELNSPESRRVEAAMMRKCGVILERLMKHRHGWVFNKPVDVVALRLPDYYEVVKRPMDLGTVKSKLDKRVYRTPLEFARDVRLTLDNAMLYNSKGEDVYNMAADLRGAFDKLFDWAYEKYKVEREGVIVENRRIERPCRKLVVKKREVKVDPETRKEIEIEKLGLVLEGLAGECLDEILGIVAKRNPGMRVPDGEGKIELDVHALDRETVWDLHRFAMLKSKAGQKAQNQNQKAV
ncbi:transcription factor GTE7 [Daucus carota subsp. sativus]|uniref:transcription factor GTE7 n=1 Tax=Daucus carota subsp. sativus TaxID=79200 RepID=UPI0007EFEB3D|nr:PREDICTED: transcription factor GTE7-like [Daucus carota subsp. sativus]